MKSLLILLSLIIVFPSINKKESENSLENAIIEVVKAWQNKDEETLNKLISNEFGVTYLYRMGVGGKIGHSERISFKNPVPDYLPYDFNLILNDYKIIHKASPIFNCDTQKWNKPTGIYCDNILTKNRPSEISKEINQFFDGNYSKKEIEYFENLEKKSRRIVIISDDENTYPNSLVFYLTLDNDDWYLTAIDRITDDCSA